MSLADGAGADKPVATTPALIARVVKLRIEKDGRMSLAFHVGHNNAMMGRDITCAADGGSPALDGVPLPEALELCKVAAGFAGSSTKLASLLADRLAKP